MIPRTSPQAFRVTASKEYGASAAILGLAKELELDRMIYTRAEPWVEGVLAMVVGRLGYAGSDLNLSQLWPRTALWELCGLDGPIDVERHCDEPMDRLEARRVLERVEGLRRDCGIKELIFVGDRGVIT